LTAFSALIEVALNLTEAAIDARFGWLTLPAPISAARARELGAQRTGRGAQPYPGSPVNPAAEMPSIAAASSRSD
jgi:hypothetical protein